MIWLENIVWLSRYIWEGRSNVSYIPYVHMVQYCLSSQDFELFLQIFPRKNAIWRYSALIKLIWIACGLSFTFSDAASILPRIRVVNVFIYILLYIKLPLLTLNCSIFKLCLFGTLGTWIVSNFVDFCIQKRPTEEHKIKFPIQKKLYNCTIPNIFQKTLSQTWN